MLVGYARIGPAEPTTSLAAQRRALAAAGCKKLFSEQVGSGAAGPQREEALAFLRQGDVLVVTTPDRLARSVTAFLAMETDLSRRGVGVVILSLGGEPLDTRDPDAQLILAILAGVASWERAVRLERQRDGIAQAKAAGKYKGRAPTVARQAEAIRALHAQGEKPTHIARKLGIARSSVYRMLGPSAAANHPDRHRVTIKGRVTDRR